MTIEIHSPEVEGLIRQRLESGAFADAEEVILHALRASAMTATGADLIAVMQASPFREVGIEPERLRQPVRNTAF